MDLENLVIRVPGSRPGPPRVAVVAHSDSAPGAPGASDDGAGVACAVGIARALVAEQPEHDVLVVITDGEHGLAAWRAGAAAAIRVPARPVRVVDTIGAGDTVDAALLVALAERRALTRAALQVLDDDQLAACLHFAAAAAAITCSRAGADLPRRAEIATPH